MKNIIKTIFYGNLFYGLCSVALSIETNLQHGVSLNSIRFYILVFLATVLFYSRIYYRSSQFFNVDDRTDWYRKHRPFIKTILMFCVAAIVVDIAVMAFINRRVLLNLSSYYWGLLAIVPLIGIMYSKPILSARKLRRIGWLKPFVIGFVWTGVVTIFPLLFWEFRNEGLPSPSLAMKTILFLQNFIFISTLAIVFDIKDYKSDKKHHLNTYPATYGIHHTVYRIIVPLTIVCFLLMVFFELTYHHNHFHIIVESIPYVILILLSKSLTGERKLLFYLAAIDGLMLLKGICGIVSIYCFN